MGKVLVKKVRFVQKESSPQECCNTSVKEFVRLDFQEENLASN
jgi:hypothetical protein